MVLQEEKLKVRPCKNGKHLDGGTSKRKHLQRDKSKGRTKTVTTVQRHPYAFLNEKIEPIPGYILDCPTWIKMDVPGTRNYLYTVFSEYLNLLGMKLESTKTNEPMGDVVTFYNEFNSKLPGNDMCNLLYEGDELPLKAVIYRINEGYDHEYCHLHLTLYDILGKKCKEWYKDFVSFLMAAQSFRPIMEHYHFEMMYDIEVNEIEMMRQQGSRLDEDERERLNDIKRMFRPYLPGGRIYKKLTDVCRKVVDAEELKASYKKLRIPKHLRPFMEHMYNAIDMLNDNYLMDYDMSITADNIQELSGCNGDNSLSLDYLLSVIYDYDEIIDAVSRSLDEEVGNAEDVSAKDFIILEPGNTKTLETSSFPNDFVHWFSKLYEIYRKTSEIIKNERSNKNNNI